MASVNKWIGIGNVGKDPVARYGSDGTCFVSLSIACNETWKDKNTGEKKEKTEWIPISFAGKLAEIVAQYVKAGSSLYVEGKYTTRKYTDKDGQDRYTTEIRADAMQMLGGRGESSEAPSRSTERPGPSRTPAASGSSDSQSSGFGDFEDDGIPF